MSDNKNTILYNVKKAILTHKLKAKAEDISVNNEVLMEIKQFIRKLNNPTIIITDHISKESNRLIEMLMNEETNNENK